MNIKSIALASAVVTTLVIAPMSSMAGHTSKQESVANLVHHMGYGAATHDFKNLVLRGRTKYSKKANAHYKHITAAIADLRQLDLSADEQAAVDGIESVMGNYQSALKTIDGMITDGKTAKEIDAAVKINDGPAVTGLKTLGAGTGSDLAKIEYALGYGNAIHNFKNCVIRTNSGKCDRAKKSLDEAMSVLNGMNGSDVDGVKATVSAYIEAIPQITKMINEGKSAEEIDGTVKISDGPAKKGLAALKK